MKHFQPLAQKQKKKANPEFSEIKILVVGDIMLDQYIVGDATRISPEAPVPVIRVQHTEFNLGGAGNVASNLVNLGCSVTVAGLVGKDEAAVRVSEMSAEMGIGGIVLETDFPTVTKVRVMAKSQQLLRMDFEETFELTPKEEKTFINLLEGLIAMHDLVILSDYAKGTITQNVAQKVIKSAAKQGIPVIADPKNKDWKRYAGAFLVTPNFGEYCEAIGEAIDNTDHAIERTAKSFLKSSGAMHILITRSEKGMSLVTPSGTTHLGVKAQQVYDVSGAGDTVIATLGACIAAGAGIEMAIEMANIAAGIVVGKSGTVPVIYEELINAWENR